MFRYFLVKYVLLSAGVLKINFQLNQFSLFGNCPLKEKLKSCIFD